MNYPDDVLRRLSQARDAAAASAYLHIQPPAAAPGLIRWALADGNWHNRPDNESYVHCHPCTDHTGAGADESVAFRVYLPRAGGTDPNVEADQVIGYVPAAGGVYVAVTGYLDDAIGTIKMWAKDEELPPIGWTECTYAGTPYRQPATVRGLEGTFPVARKDGDPDFGTVGDTGNLDRKEHCHQLEMNMPDPPCIDAWINTGTWNTETLGMYLANHLPPWCVVRFIERYDNSIL